MAASRAIAELINARKAYAERCHGWADYHCEETQERLRVAEMVRKQYSEYGDPNE
jgi:hypothetical protein